MVYLLTWYIVCCTYMQEMKGDASLPPELVVTGWADLYSSICIMLSTPFFVPLLFTPTVTMMVLFACGCATTSVMVTMNNHKLWCLMSFSIPEHRHKSISPTLFQTGTGLHCWLLWVPSNRAKIWWQTGDSSKHKMCWLVTFTKYK